MNPAPAWMPPKAADIAGVVDWTFEITLFVTVFLAVLVAGLLVLFAFVYRTRGDQSAVQTGASWSTQTWWVLAPMVICGYLFGLGVPGYLWATRQRSESYTVLATIQTWTEEEAETRPAGVPPLATWYFTYPGGYCSRDLHLPAHEKIHLVVRGDEVAHTLYAPALRLDSKAVPGHDQEYWFKTFNPGTYPIHSTVYSGADTLGMRTRLMIREKSEFDAWLQDASNDFSKLPPAEAGKVVFDRNGCSACHSIDGTKLVGPTFKGLYGTSEMLTDGSTVLVDDAYITESLFDPTAKVTKGYEPVMPPFTGRIPDEHVAFLIEFIKSLSGEGAQ